MKKQTINKALKNLTLDGIFSQARIGITANYLIPLALMLGATNEFIGILNAIPHLMGMVFQPMAAKINRFFNNKKFVTVFFSLLHRLFWIPLVIVPFVVPNGLIWLLLFLAISSIFSHIATTTWTSWMMHLVPKKIRGIYFGKRNMISNLSAFVTSLLAGWYLGIIDGAFGFITLFIFATFLGLISSYYLSKIPNIKSKAKPYFHFSFKKFFKGYVDHENYSNFVIFMSLAYFSITIASPFVVVYILRDLNLSYSLFAIAIAIQALFDMISQPYWGKFSDKFGDRTTLIICFSMAPFSILAWAFISSFWQIIILQVFTGFIWAGFNLSVFNYLLDSTPSIDSVRFIGNYRMFTAFGNFFGPLTGGLLATYFASQTFFIFSGLQLLFILAFVMRLLLAIYMIPRVKEIRVKAKTRDFKNIYLKALVKYPLHSVSREILHIIQHVHYEKK